MVYMYYRLRRKIGCFLIKAGHLLYKNFECLYGLVSMHNPGASQCGVYMDQGLTNLIPSARG